ncbi:MAG TPA: 2-oxoacid:ferredoxin oxidoreductase subunit beta, partial [Actinobacteria bacterium]|nr:2-oxoacid:ferredoxin oxidoreductase subunit beta [Actinomycetota bacterium]
PTSEQGKITKSTPEGSLDYSFNPVSLALGAEATFVARTIDSDRKHMTDVLRAAAHHEGTSLVEIYQNCNIFNDGAWEPLKDGDTRDDMMMRLEHGEPIRFGKDMEKGVIRTSEGHIAVADVAEVGEDAVIRHDAHAKDPGLAFALSRLSNPRTLENTPIGIFRAIERPSYDRLVREQLAEVQAKHGEGDLQSLLNGGDTWNVS